jgi:Domain of unknown function (DUF4263)
MKDSIVLNKHKISKNGLMYTSPTILREIIKDKKTVITKVQLTKIPHNDPNNVHISLKIGRYKKINNTSFVPHSAEFIDEINPKSELTLDKDEFNSLIGFLQTNLISFKEGCSNFVKIDQEFKEQQVELIRTFFLGDREEVLELILENELIAIDLHCSLRLKLMKQAVDKFEKELDEDKNEVFWQNFFQQNRWIMGSDFIEILDHRRIDESNIADYLVKAYDGYLDLIELKRPDGNLKFWAESKDHNNYYQSSDLTKAITQVINYLSVLEKEMNSLDFYEKHNNTSVVRPRATLIFGRSKDWDKEKVKAYRLLVNQYNHSVHILTFDHVLARAKRILEIEKQYESEINEI